MAIRYRERTPELCEIFVRVRCIFAPFLSIARYRVMEPFPDPMITEKPILVHHRGRWRSYRGSRELLTRTSIGDVIPVLPAPLCEDAAIAYLRTHPDACADLVSVEPLPDEVWELLPTLIGLDIDTFCYSDPFT